MNQIINDCLISLNKAGSIFYSHAAATFIQSALLVIVLCVIDLLLRKWIRSIFRYCLWLLVLVKLILPPTLSLPTGIGYWVGGWLPFTAEVSQQVQDETYFREMRTSMPLVHGPSTDASEDKLARTGMESERPTRSEKPISIRITWKTVLFLLWFSGICFFLILLKRRARYVGTLLATSSPADKGTICLLEQCRQQIDLRRHVGLRVSDTIPSPAVCGFLKPTVLIPTRLLEKLSSEGLRSALIHELAHIKRGDLWVNGVQTLIQIIYFYNPFVWFANTMIRRICEEAVDEAVLVTLGGEAENYSDTLIDISETVIRRTGLSLRLIGVAESRKALQWRIRHMLNRPIPKSSKLGVLSIIVVIIIAAVLLPMAKAQRPERGSKLTTEHDAKTAVAVAPIPIQPPTFRKIWNLRGYDAQLSPDGKSIALAPAGKLCIIPRDSTVGPDDPDISHFFVNTAEIGVDPHGLAWSGNGRWIAFNDGLVHTGKRMGNTRMYVVSAQGGEPKEIYDAYLNGSIHLPWKSLSPDGKTLAFSAQDANEMHVYTISVEEGMPKRLVEVPARNPVFSPDGRMIAYVEDKNAGHGGGALWVVPVGGGTPRRVAEAKDAWSPVWSPDGRMIAFFDFEGDRQICIIPVNERGEPAGEKITIANPKPKEAGLLWRLTGWTPDNKIGIICSNPGSVGLYTLSPNGGPATLVTHTGTEGIRQPRWSPDGKRIIYVKWPCEDGSNWLYEGLVSVPAEGGEVTTIPIESDTKIFIAPWGIGGSVSPDGKTIVFAGCKAQEAVAAAITVHLWTLPIEGGRATQLTNAAPPLTDWYPCWSPDGKAIAFVRSRSSQLMLKMFTEADIYIIPSTGGEPRQLSSESDRVSLGSIAWSPDSKLLAYESTDKELSPPGHTLRVIPAKGGESRVVAKLRPMHQPNELAWSPDSRRIAFNDGGIQIISLDDGRVADIDPGMTTTKLYDLDWSRDGARLVFTGYEGGGNGFWLMENFLPAANSPKASK